MMRRQRLTPTGVLPAVRAGRMDERALREEEVEESLAAVFAAFRKRLISLPTMSLPLRLLTIFVILLVLLIGGGIALRDQMPASLTFFQGTVQVPLVSLIAVSAALLLAWSLILTGALHSRWFFRFPALVVFTFLSGVEANTLAQSGDASTSQLVLGELAAVLALWIWGIVLGVVGLRAARRDRAVRNPTARLAGLTLLIVLAALAAHYALIVLPLLSGTHPESVAEVVTNHVESLFILLIPVFVLSGMHFADIGHEAGRHIAALAWRKRVYWPLEALTLLAALGICVRLVVELAPTYGGSTSGAVAAALTLAAVGLFVTPLARLVLGFIGWLGRVDRWPRVEVPTNGVLLLLAVPWAVLLVLAVLADALLPGGVPGVLGTLIVAGLVTVVLCGALVLVLSGRWRVGPLAVTGLFALVALLVAPYLGLHAAEAIPGFELLVSPATLIVLLWLLLRRRLDEDTVELVRVLFLLNVGLQVIDLVRRVYPVAPTSTNQLSAIQSVLFIGAFLWHLLLSGDQITNIDGTLLPRYVRVLVYLGYSLLAATVVLFLASASSTDPSAHAPLSLTPLFNNNLYARAGLQLLGVPLLLTLFVLELNRWRGRQRAAAARLGPRGAPTRRARRAREGYPVPVMPRYPPTAYPESADGYASPLPPAPSYGQPPARR
jgi:hypothetical protein